MNDDNVIDLAAYRKAKQEQLDYEEEQRLRELIDRSMAYSYFAMYGLGDKPEEDDD